jgi:hypothetical protein
VTLKNITVDKAITPAKIQYAPGLKVENVKINGEKFRAKPE